MLLLDARAGSKDLAPYFDKLRVPYRLDTLEYGDVSFLGRGPDDTWVDVGVEYKTLTDVLACITTGRYAGHQLIGMRRDFGAVGWLLIEGIWRYGREGVVEIRDRGTWTPLRVGGRAYMGRDLDKFLFSITHQSGTRIWRTPNKDESAAWLGALYHWWTTKTWDEHASLQTFDLSGPQLGQITPPRLARRIAKELPGLGWKRSATAEAHFGTALAMVLADEKEWRAVPGVGKEIARRIVKAVAGAGEGDDQ